MTPIFDEKSATLSVSADLNRVSLHTDGWWNLEPSVCSKLKTLEAVSFDLSDLGHIDSAGLAWLINFKRDAGIDNVIITFTSVPVKLKQLALLSGVESILILER